MRSAKITIVLGLVLALLLTTTAGAFAQAAGPEPGSEARPRAVRGIVVDKSARAFEIRKADGDRLTVLVDAQTKFRMDRHPGFGLKDLQRGDQVTALGKVDKNGDLTARLVNVAPRKPKVIRLAGTVTHADNNRLTVETPKGDSVTLTLNDKTRFVPADAKPKKGDRVTVVGVKAWGEEEIVARLVAMRKAPAPDKS